MSSTGSAVQWGLTLTNSITAGSTQTQAGATALTAMINRVTVSGTNGDGVKLPTAIAGLEVLIINDDSAQTIQVWPNTSDAINGGSANAVDAKTLAAGGSRRYAAIDATNWYTISDVDVSTNAVGVLPYNVGGTAQSSFAQGDIIYASAANTLAKLAKGSDDDTLMMDGNVPNWEAVAAGGLDRIGIFRLTTSFTGDAEPIESNWEEADTFGYGKGNASAAVTESSGIFTFAATGVYVVYWHVEAYGTNDHGTTSGNIRVTTNGGTNYYDSAYGNASISVVDAANTHANTNTFQIIDCTNTSNVKVAFSAATHSSNTIYGSSNQNVTFAMFLRVNST
jgi:hypothetical protein